MILAENEVPVAESKLKLCMSVLGLLAAVTMFVLTNVFAGMLPTAFTGDAQLAVWLIALVVAIVSYIMVEQAMAGIR